MRCQHKSCGGLIVKQVGFGPYPERFYCQSCGREPKGGQDMPEAGQTKICVKCGTEKLIGEFGVLRSSGDGHNPLCFKCKRKRDHDSRTNQASKGKAPDRKSRPGKLKSPKPPEKKITVQHEESAEAQLIKAFKKTTIKSFIRDDLIPMLERAVEERFE